MASDIFDYFQTSIFNVHRTVLKTFNPSIVQYMPPGNGRNGKLWWPRNCLQSPPAFYRGKLPSSISGVFDKSSAWPGFLRKKGIFWWRYSEEWNHICALSVVKNAWGDFSEPQEHINGIILRTNFGGKKLDFSYQAARCFGKCTLKTCNVGPCAFVKMNRLS